MSVVEWLLVIFFVIPIICLCGMFLYEAEKMQNAEARNEQ